MQKKFWGGDTGASIFAPTALKLNVTPPKKNPSYGLACSLFHFAQEWTRSPAGEPILVHEWTRPHG